jgi:hypothetical protein
VSQPELLKLVGQRLAAAGIDYMVSGAIASSLQGEPRTTHDIDIVVAVSAPAADAAACLKALFSEPEFYLDEDAAREAIERQGMFDLIDTREGDDDTFDQTRFGRRYVEIFEGVRLTFSRPEDTILMKLRWAATLDVRDALMRLRAEARPIE